MGVANVMQSGKTGLMASRTAIATTGHNITNVNSEGYSRQRVGMEARAPHKYSDKAYIGTGVEVSRVDRVNDQYLEKQIRNSGRDLAYLEEKEFLLRHVEDVFNELDGEGINRLVANFFNDFRKLSNEPESHSLREAVRESTNSLAGSFRSMRLEVEGIRNHIDARLAGYVGEVNSLIANIGELNDKIRVMELTGGPANDLRDKRDLNLKKLGSYFDLQSFEDEHGNAIVNLRGVGPLVASASHEKFSVERSPADDQGKPDGALELKTTASAFSNVTHQIKSGRIGALFELRDKTVGMILDRLDEMAYTLTENVNAIHRQGFTRDGRTGLNYFQPLEDGVARASQFIKLSDEVRGSATSIATGAVPDSPGDNRIALAISGIQNLKLMEGGRASMDDYYNSIMSDVGILAARTKDSIGQQKNVQQQLGKIREQISGVSLDEETANLLQFQHTYDASAKVIQVADEMLKTVLDLKRV